MVNLQVVHLAYVWCVYVWVCMCMYGCVCGTVMRIDCVTHHLLHVCDNSKLQFSETTLTVCTYTCHVWHNSYTVVSNCLAGISCTQYFKLLIKYFCTESHCHQSRDGTC